MAEMPKYSGLCETCDHDASCMLRRSSKLEIIQCEEFSTQPVVPKAAVVVPEGPSPDPTEAARMGLCANCRDVDTCGFPNARHGVLQCEEYVLDEAGPIAPARHVCSRSAA